MTPEQREKREAEARSNLDSLEKDYEKQISWGIEFAKIAIQQMFTCNWGGLIAIPSATAAFVGKENIYVIAFYPMVALIFGLIFAVVTVLCAQEAFAFQARASDSFADRWAGEIILLRSGSLDKLAEPQKRIFTGNTKGERYQKIARGFGKAAGSAGFFSFLSFIAGCILFARNLGTAT